MITIWHFLGVPYSRCLGSSACSPLQDVKRRTAHLAAGTAGEAAAHEPGGLCRQSPVGNQGGVEGLLDLVGRRRRAVAVLAVRRAALAPGRLRVGLGRPLAEGGGLTLRSAASLVELGLQRRELLTQRLGLGAEALVLPDQIVVGSRHAETPPGRLRCSQLRSDPPSRQGPAKQVPRN